MSHVDELLPNVRAIVGIWVVRVHVLDCVEDAFRVESVVVLHDVIADHHIEEFPTHVIVGGQSLVLI